MKKVSILMSILLLGIIFCSCEKKNKSQITINPSAVEIIVGENITVEISGGIAPYTPKEVDKTIATATVDKKELKITGVKVGQTSVEVTDKDGAKGLVVVKVIKDLYEDAKKDAATRIEWDALKKVMGTDKGTYTMSKAKDKTVTFTWKSEDEKNSAGLSIKDPNDLIKEPASKMATKATMLVAGKLSVTTDGKATEYPVSAWKLIQAKPAKEGEPTVFWITFKANNKNGLCVAQLEK